MPTWEEITPLTEKAPYRRAGATTTFLVLAGLGAVGSAVLQFGFQISHLEWLGFSENQAVGNLWLWQFLSYVFAPTLNLHTLWVVDFALGAFLIWKFGRELEQEVGAARMLGLLFGSVAYGAAAHAIFQAVADSTVPAAGIFPAVFAVLVTGALRWPGRTVMFLMLFPMRFVTATLVGLGIVLFVSVIEFRTGVSGFFAVLGASAAAFVGENINIRMNRWAEERGQKLARQKDRDDSELRIRADEILDKISREGMDSLSAEEKRILKRASKLMAEKGEEHE